MTKRRDFLKKMGMLGVGVGATGIVGTTKGGELETPVPSYSRSSTPKTVWRMQTYASPQLAQHVIKPSIDLFNRIAGDEMVIELYYNDHIPSNEIFHALKDGTLDAVQADDQSVSPETDISVFGGYFPFACRYSLDIPALFHHWGLEEIWAEAYGKVKGITWLSAGAWDPCHFITNKAIHSVDDFNGLSLYTFPTAGRFLSRLGVRIVKNLPWNHITDSLKFNDGSLDGVAWCGITEAYTIGWADVASYFLSNSISGAWCGSYFANSKSWDRLPNHLRNLFRACVDSSHYYRQHWYWSEEAKLRVNGKKLKTTSIPEKDWQYVKSEAYVFWDEVSKMSSRNNQVIKILRAYNETMSKVYPSFSSHSINEDKSGFST